jgi:hypothetical protein
MRRWLRVFALLLPTSALLLGLFFLRARRPEAPPAAPPAALLSGDTLVRLRATCRGRLDLDPLRLDPQPLARASFERMGSSGPMRCQVHGSSGQPLREVSCAPEQGMLQGMTQIGAEGEGVMLAGLDGVFREDGKKVGATPVGRTSADRVFVLGSGAVVKLRDALGGQRSGATWQQGEARQEVDAPSSAFLVAGHLLWEADGALRVRRLLGTAPGFGPEQEVGKAPGFMTGSLRACRREGGWSVALPEPQAAGVVFRVHQVGAGGWGPGVEVRGDGVRGETWALACAGERVQIGWVTGEGQPRVARCEAERCEVEEGAARPELAAAWTEPGGGPLAIPLGPAVALLWSQGRGLEGRVGPLAGLAAAPTVRLLDEPVALAMSELLSRGEVALLWLRPPGAPHVYPVRLDGRGFTPLSCGEP